MKSDTALGIVGTILKIFGMPTGLFSMLKELKSLGNDITKDNQPSKKEKFIQELTKTAKSITESENYTDDVLYSIDETLNDSKLFSAEKILEYFNNIDGYAVELTNSKYGIRFNDDKSAESYKRAIHLLLEVIYNNLPLLDVASDSDVAILEKLYSYEKLSEENQTILLELKYRGTSTEWLDRQMLPAAIESNIFNYCNPQIHFHGREEEMKNLEEYVEKSGVSIWGIVGPGGSGKSKLARAFAEKIMKNVKCVWLNSKKATEFDELLRFKDYSYSKPVLFICDYAAQLEDRLIELLNKLATHRRMNVKFLLLERQLSWYLNFVKHNDLVYDFAAKNHKAELQAPIDLTNAELDMKACKEIIYDLSVSRKGEQRRYPDANLQPNDYDIIIEKARNLAENNTSIRCLFMLLLADAFLCGRNIQEMDTEALLHNYIERTKSFIQKSYGDDMAKKGFQILAYATAIDGIKLENKYPAIQDELKFIIKKLDDTDEINEFFGQLSEIEENETVSALKPDLIGEFLFLYTWNKLTNDKRKSWLFELLKNDESKTFHARCLIDWKKESEKLCEMLSNVDAESEQRVQCAAVFNIAVYEAHIVEDQVSYIQKIKNLNQDNSISILLSYVDSISYVYDNLDFQNRKEYVDYFDKLDWKQFKCKTDEEKQMYATALSYTAIIYNGHSDYDKALEYYKKAIGILEKMLGTEHPDTATSYNNIAGVYGELGDYDKALEYYKKAIGILEKMLGTEHPDTASSYNNIAVVYRAIGDYDKALEYNKKAIGIREKVLGTEHPDTATSYNNIAGVYRKLGDYNKALEYYKKALIIYETIHGTEHPDTATSYDNIAGVYEDKGDYDKALEYYKKAIDIREKMLGTEHPDTASSYDNIAGVYEDKGDYDKALEYYKKAIDIREKMLGTEHPDTATSYNNIAGIYSDLGDYDKALEYYKKAIGILEKMLGTEHPDTASSYNNIAVVYRAIGDYDKALEYNKKDMIISEKILGTEHPDTASSYNNIAVVYHAIGFYYKALKYYKKAIGILEKMLGTEHPYTATSYNNIAGVYHALGDYDKALEYYKKAIGILEKMLGTEHPYTATSYNNIAVVYRAMGDYNKALEYEKK